MHDRDYYRSLDAIKLLIMAVENGINSEMAIALADKLASTYAPILVGGFTFDEKESVK
ncbi:MAG: hypothetical protein KGL39_42155 [Patescibacteria group bacterium]|nr:hypothetical protein [Patescibacteria group bacterium]